MSKLASATFSVVSIAFIITSIIFTFLSSDTILVSHETLTEYSQAVDPVSSIAYLLNNILLDPQPHLLLTFSIWGLSIFLVGLQLDNLKQAVLLPLFAIILTIILSFLVSTIGILSNAVIFRDYSSLFALGNQFESFMDSVINNNIKNIIMLYIGLIIPSAIGYKVADTYLVEYIEEEPEKLL